MFHRDVKNCLYRLTFATQIRSNSVPVFRLKQYRFGIARLLLSLYVAVLVNGVVFRHSHRLADGTILCHAHPYKSSPGTQFPNHAHSRDELIWLDTFANALYANSDPVKWLALIAVILLLRVDGGAPTSASFSVAHVAFRHRGPPVHLGWFLHFPYVQRPDYPLPETD